MMVLGKAPSSSSSASLVSSLMDLHSSSSSSSSSSHGNNHEEKDDLSHHRSSSPPPCATSHRQHHLVPNTTVVAIPPPSSTVTPHTTTAVSSLSLSILRQHAETQWRRAANVLRANPHFMTKDLLRLTLQHRPPVHVVQFMLDLLLPSSKNSPLSTLHSNTRVDDHDNDDQDSKVCDSSHHPNQQRQLLPPSDLLDCIQVAMTRGVSPAVLQLLLQINPCLLLEHRDELLQCAQQPQQGHDVGSFLHHDRLTMEYQLLLQQPLSYFFAVHTNKSNNHNDKNHNYSFMTTTASETVAAKVNDENAPFHHNKSQPSQLNGSSSSSSSPLSSSSSSPWAIPILPTPKQRQRQKHRPSALASIPEHDTLSNTNLFSDQNESNQSSSSPKSSLHSEPLKDNAATTNTNKRTSCTSTSTPMKKNKTRNIPTTSANNNQANDRSLTPLGLMVFPNTMAAALMTTSSYSTSSCPEIAHGFSSSSSSSSHRDGPPDDHHQHDTPLPTMAALPNHNKSNNMTILPGMAERILTAPQEQEKPIGSLATVSATTIPSDAPLRIPTINHHNDNTSISTVQKEELENVKRLCMLALKGQKRLAQEWNQKTNVIQQQQQQLQHAVDDSAGDVWFAKCQELQDRQFKTQLIALDMKEKAMRAQVQHMERSVIEELKQVRAEYQALLLLQQQQQQQQQLRTTATANSMESKLASLTRRLDEWQARTEQHLNKLETRMNHEAQVNSRFRTYQYSQLDNLQGRQQEQRDDDNFGADLDLGDEDNATKTTALAEDDDDDEDHDRHDPHPSWKLDPWLDGSLVSPFTQSNAGNKKSKKRMTMPFVFAPPYGSSSNETDASLDSASGDADWLLPGESMLHRTTPQLQHQCHQQNVTVRPEMNRKGVIGGNNKKQTASWWHQSVIHLPALVVKNNPKYQRVKSWSGRKQNKRAGN
jgi:hypothetical protein